jgi:hypothetical protein
MQSAKIAPWLCASSVHEDHAWGTAQIIGMALIEHERASISLGIP